MSKPDGYKEKVTDEQLIQMIETGVANSSGDWLNSSDLARERLKATYEYAGLAENHLTPQGVSTIVDTSTTEVVEAYTAIISDLFLSNHKLARFIPYDETPGSFAAAKDAGNIVNYCLFKKNNGWELMQQWIKASLLWKNAICRWSYIEDYDYIFEEFEQISQAKLDELLADDTVEIVGELQSENVFAETDPLQGDMQPNAEIMYTNVRIKKTIDKSRVKIEIVPPENFRLSREATCITDANFVGIQTEMTRSELRKLYPEVADNITEWDELSNEEWLGSTQYSEDVAARKEITGQEYWQGNQQHDLVPLEANRNIVLTESWINVDRDGDGLSLIHI